MKRIVNHPILEDEKDSEFVEVYVDGKRILAREGNMIAAALIENGYRNLRITSRNHEPRSIYCGIGQCTDCMMEVDGIPGIRTCITPIRRGMVINTLIKHGTWRIEDEND